jgi:hypothetical protein
LVASSKGTLRDTNTFAFRKCSFFTRNDCIFLVGTSFWPLYLRLGFVPFTKARTWFQNDHDADEHCMQHSYHKRASEAVANSAGARQPVAYTCRGSLVPAFGSMRSSPLHLLPPIRFRYCELFRHNGCFEIELLLRRSTELLLGRSTQLLLFCTEQKKVSAVSRNCL